MTQFNFSFRTRNRSDFLRRCQKLAAVIPITIAVLAAGSVLMSRTLRLLWSKPKVYFNWKYFNINGATLKNPKESIPITIAAKGKRMMGIAAKHVDLWESSYLSPEQFASTVCMPLRNAHSMSLLLMIIWQYMAYF